MTGSHPQASGSDDLQSLLANAAGHLKCVLAGIVVPDKGLVLTWPESGDASILTRTQKQLLAITQTRRDPLVINRIATQAGQVAIPYRILACPLRQGSGRTSGVLALFRKLDAPEFVGRDVHLADLLARRVAASIETSYDTLSGLLTRAALEQRVKLMLGRAENRADERWSLLYVDIDELHVINENFGMHVGDQAIAQIGDLLRKHLPPNSVAARISGDRFAVVMPSDIDEAAMFGEGLREGVTRLSTAASMRASVCPSAWASRRSAAATAISAVRWPKPSRPARPPRIAAATGSRPSRKTTSASSAASPTSTWPPTCAPRSRRTACGSKRR